jgi:uncharacterized protein (DUF1501 family)
LLKGGLGARVIYTTQPGYDTHTNQIVAHELLLSELSGALAAFLDDLITAKLDDRVNVLCFSEFGRRVTENGSGTDHGTAGPVFVAGSQIRAGVVGATPSLLDLDIEGDLKWSIDFRRVYATLLDQWLGLPAAEALGGSFEPVRILRA